MHLLWLYGAEKMEGAHKAHGGGESYWSTTKALPVGKVTNEIFEADNGVSVFCMKVCVEPLSGKPLFGGVLEA